MLVYIIYIIIYILYLYYMKIYNLTFLHSLDGIWINNVVILLLVIIYICWIIFVYNFDLFQKSTKRAPIFTFLIYMLTKNLAKFFEIFWGLPQIWWWWVVLVVGVVGGLCMHNNFCFKSVYC